MEPTLECLLNFQLQDVTETKTLGKMSKEKIAYILSNCEVDENACWIWNGRVADIKKGHQHGIVWFKKNWRYVHRLMFHNFVEEVPEYERKPNCLQVNHRCSHENNGRCINPLHLYLGTPKDNMQDALKEGTKNRPPCGEKNYNAVVSDEVVQQVLALSSSMTQKEIAELVGVNQSQVSRWINKKTRTNQS